MRTLVHQKEVKVRKDHICQGCGEKVKKGDKSYCTRMAGDEIYSYYECERCKEFYNKYCMDCQDNPYCVGENYEIGVLVVCDREMETGHYEEEQPCVNGGKTT